MDLFVRVIGALIGGFGVFYSLLLLMFLEASVIGSLLLIAVLIACGALLALSVRGPKRRRGSSA